MPTEKASNSQATLIVAIPIFGGFYLKDSIRGREKL